jgi:Glycosyltransferase family 87
VPPDSTSASAPTTADRITVLVLVLVSASTTATALARPLSSLGRAGLLALAFAALGLATGVGWWRHALGMRTVLIVTLALLVVAVTYWPRNSTDVWSYAAYGRMVSHYGASPYRHVPVEYSNDRAIRRVKPMWQNTSSVYGPLWNGISAGVVSVTGTHLQSTRMWFQALAALSVFLAALLIARRTRAPAAVALIGLNPLVIYDIVNGGHNDALVGLALLAGVILATRERFVLAALVIALGALIKLVALLGLVALGRLDLAQAWSPPGSSLGRRRGRRRRHPVCAERGPRRAQATARSTPPDEPQLDLVAQRLGRADEALRPRPRAARNGFPTTCRHAVDGRRAVLAGILIASRLRDRTPTLVVGSALVAYLLAATYVLPWYVAWALPVLVLEWRSGLTRLVLAQSALYLLVYQYRQGVPDSLPYQTLFASNVVLVLFELTMIVALVVMIVRQRRPDRARVETVGQPTPVPARLD